MKRHFPIIIEQDKDGIFIVDCPALKGCRSYGSTVNEAVENIREAIEACIEDVESQERGMMFIGVRDLEVAVP